MNIEEFFQKLKPELLPPAEYYDEASWYHVLTASGSDNITNKKIGLIGISEPGEDVPVSYEIRKHLYALKKAEYADDIIDLGDFVFDYKFKTYQSLGFVLSELMNMGITPVILNGRQDITYSQYLAFTYLKRYITLVSLDSHIDFNLRENEELSEKNYLQKIFMEEPSYLFHFINIGYQTHFADPSILNFLDRLFFDSHRLGDTRADMSNMEPVMRQAHMVSWDLGAIRQSDAPGSVNASPNGFFGEEACQLSRFAGISSGVKTFGVYGYTPEKDRDGQTAQLTAQMLWYFVDGYMNRYPENPVDNKDEFLKFITSIQNNAYQIVFYKSKRTDRWWMEVPINEKEFVGSHHIVPCSYKDYLAATQEELPERWWQAMKKLS